MGLGGPCYAVGGSRLLMREPISPVISAGQRVGGLGGAWGAAAPGGAARLCAQGLGVTPAAGPARRVLYFIFVFFLREMVPPRCCWRKGARTQRDELSIALGCLDLALEML